jgi:sugar transferase (PEP-CTERM/EpsH1 system associated)
MKILALLSRVPYRLDKGDKLRAYHQLRKLAERHEVILFAISEEPENIRLAAQAELEKFCKHVILFPLHKFQVASNLLVSLRNHKPFQVNYFYDKAAQKAINKLISEYQPDQIYCQLIRMAEYVRHVKNIPTTLDYMDTFSKGMLRRAEIAPIFLKSVYNLEAQRLLQYEADVFPDFQHTTIISRQDRTYINHPRNNEIEIIPNGIDTDFFAPKNCPKKYEIVFAGNMNYAPNVDTAVFLVKKVLPLIQQQIPEIKLLLAGANPAGRVKALAGSNVTVSGWLDDIRDAYCSAKVFVAPMFIGTGVQNKILEAMAMEIPCVTSPLVNNGVGSIPGEHLLIGNNAEEFANQVIKLLNNTELAAEIAKNALKFVRENYDWSKAVQRLEQVMEGKFDKVRES